MIVKNYFDYIILSWSPPFSLDVTDMDPDIWYTVLISNVTDEHSPTTVPCYDCDHFARLHYNFTTNKPNPCHKYRFIVISQNGAGDGNRSDPVNTFFCGSKLNSGTGVWYPIYIVCGKCVGVAHVLLTSSPLHEQLGLFYLLYTLNVTQARKFPSLFTSIKSWSDQSSSIIFHAV